MNSGEINFDVKGSVCFVLEFALPSLSPPLYALLRNFQNKTCTEPLTSELISPQGAGLSERIGALFYKDHINLVS